MRVLTLDPGKTTGVAYLDTDKGRFESDHLTQYEVYGYLDNVHFYSRLDYLIGESFQFRPRTKADLTPVEIIGVIKQWAMDNPIAKLYWQTAAQVKHYFTDERLKEYGRLKTPKSKWPHANDATRHLLYFLEFGEGKRYGISGAATDSTYV